MKSLRHVVHIVRTEQPPMADAPAITTTNVHLFSGESFGERALLSDTDMRAGTAIEVAALLCNADCNLRVL